MATEKKFPDHFVKTKMHGKKKKVIIYRRNNLSADHFSYDPNYGYTFDEEYSFKGIIIHLHIHLNSNSIYDLFTLEYPKSFKLKGGTNHMGIKATLSVAGFPGAIRGVIGPVSFFCEFSGTYKNLYLDNPTSRIRAERRKSNVGVVHSSISCSSVDVPPSVSWAASHPFQGGGFSPR